MKTVKHATLLQKFFKKAPKTPAHRPSDSTLTRTWSTPAQIGAYADAFFDRARYQAGDVDDLEIKEPGLKVRELGFLDLTGAPLVVKPTSDAPWLSLTPTVAPERRLNRIRLGE